MDTIYIIIIIVLLGLLLVSYAYSRMVHEEVKFLWHMLDLKTDNLNELELKG